MTPQAREFLTTHRPAEIVGKRTADLPDGVRHLTKDAAAPVEQAGARTFKFIVSTGAVDRENDVIRQDGWQLDAFHKNPVVLLEHGAIPAIRSIPIGRATTVGVEGNALKAAITFEAADIPIVGAYAEMAVRLCRSGTLRATSVGFRPLTWSVPKGEQRRGDEWAPGIDFETMELMEISICGIPANPETLLAERSVGRGLRSGSQATRTASPRPKMPPPPEQSQTPIVYMRKNEMAAEREKLEAWMVKVAALEMNRAETAIYDQVKYRADELYAFERMSR